MAQTILEKLNLLCQPHILYLEQTALSAVSGLVQFHNNEDNGTPILRCTTNTKTVLSVPADGSIIAGAPLRLVTHTVDALPDPVASGAGAMVYVSNASDGGVPAFCDGSVWRRITDRNVIA